MKPTFIMDHNKLYGPYFEQDFYYGGLAITTIVGRAYLKLTENPYPNQKILTEFREKLPSSNNGSRQDIADAEYCYGNIELSQDDFYKSVLNLDPSKYYTIVTSEDVSHGRSHFSPYIFPRSELVSYEIEITKALIGAIKVEANLHGARFIEFTQQSPFEDGLRRVRYVKTTDNRYYRISLDYLKIASEVIDENDSIILGLSGGEELYVSKDDRHLGIVGNKKLMGLLSSKISDLVGGIK